MKKSPVPLAIEAFDEHARRTIEAFSKFFDEVKAEFDRAGILTLESAQALTVAQKGIDELRDTCIASAVLSGVSGRRVAEIYNLTPGRVSQIKSSYEKKLLETKSDKEKGNDSRHQH